jgi:hypothetical protein
VWSRGKKKGASDTSSAVGSAGLAQYSVIGHTPECLPPGKHAKARPHGHVAAVAYRYGNRICARSHGHAVAFAQCYSDASARALAQGHQADGIAHIDA